MCCEPTDDEHGRRADGRRRGLRHVLILRDQPADLYGQLVEANDPEEQADADAAAEAEIASDQTPANQGDAGGQVVRTAWKRSSARRRSGAW